MTSRIGPAGLLLRHLRSGAAGAVTLAVFVLLSSALLAALPGALDRIGAAELQYRTAHESPNARFPAADIRQDPPLGLPADRWKPFTAALAGVRSQAAPLLRRQLGPARFTIFTEVVDLPLPPKGYPVSGTFRLVLAADPRQRESMRLVSGSWPAPINVAAADRSPIGIVLSTATAQRMGWTVGQIKRPVSDGESTVEVVLTGTFADTAGSDDYWTLNRSVLLPAVKHTVANGDIITGTGFVDPNSWPATSAFAPMGHLRIYYPLSLDGVRRSSIEPLRAHLLQFTNGVRVFPATDGVTGSPGPRGIALASHLPETLASVLATVASARSVLSVLAIGPGGAALAVLTLATGLLAARRRRTLSLLSTRGASAPQLRSINGLEALLLTVAPATVGVATAFLVLPPDDVLSALILPALAVLLPVGLLAVSATVERTGRQDLTTRSVGRSRLLFEIALVLAAAGSTVLLYRTGVRAGLDPLVVLAPLLISLASAAAVLRLFPLPMLLLQRFFRRQRGLIEFLGSARATRQSAVGFAPILALVIGIAVAVLSAVLLTTLRQGVTAASVSQVGADLRIDRPEMSQDDVRRVAALPGVAGVASQYSLGGVPIGVAGIEQGIEIYLVDTRALSLVQRGISGAVALPAGLTERHGGALPVVTSPGLAAELLTLTGRPLVVLGASATTVGLGTATQWIIADKAFLTEFGATVYSPETLLVRLDRQTDPAAVAGRIPTVVDQPGVGTSGELSARLLASPIVGGFQVVVLGALTIMGLLCTAAVLMTAVAGAPARRQLLGVLRILGLPSRATSALVAWELTPIAAAALLGGGAAGAGLARVVTDVVDLRPFTGGAVQPDVVITLPVVAALAGGFSLLVAAAIAVSAALARRAGLAAVLRFGEE